MIWAYILLMYSATCLSLPTPALAANFSLKDPGNIVSENSNFKFGFFSPPNTKNRYLGIWYNNVSPTYYVWVANRNNPLTDSSGVLTVSEGGGVQLTNANKDVFWSLNLTRPAQNATRNIKLLNSGNLLVIDQPPSENRDTNGTVLWQSFDHATDSLLPNMKIAMNETDLQRLYAWKSASDPSVGRYSLGLDSSDHPQMVIWDGNKRHYRSGPWNGNVFIGMRYADPTADYADTYIQKDDTGNGVTLVYTGAINLTFSHYSFDFNGSLSEVAWDSGSKSWMTLYEDPIDPCDFYGKCGTFGTCNSGRTPICRCLKGFAPKNPGQWSRGNWSSGCVRNTPLQCGVKGKDQNGFMLLKTVKLPDLEEWLSVLNQNDCRNRCLQNCSCLAYAYDAGAGCMYWTKDLIDIQEFSSGGINLFLLLASSELRNKEKKKSIIIGASVVSGTSSIALIILFLWLRLSRRKEKEAKRKHILETINYNDKTNQKTKFEELPFFEFGILVDATLNFNISHKLGQGGFGQVFKGKLKDGQEIAVKRLSAASGQGLEEFRNEVIVISRLQHMNLVKLIGFSVEGDEKLLVYEYMPNKSLSAFLFDPVKREILDWKKRLHIIEGICRGLIYLHRDSRLRIIHRDLKASNILLDEELNPKISDFGMARIFKHGQDQDETRRVVGTYGYMAPEYAMEGHFSEKSDVYSFGVLLLEIVSGRRNSSFWCEEESLTLVGHVWKLWLEGEALSIIDPTISNPNCAEEIKLSIQVGLLCVQENVKDRPSTSTVMSMLSADIESLPQPKQPGFHRRLNVTDDGSSHHQYSGGNNMSITALSAR